MVNLTTNNTPAIGQTAEQNEQTGRLFYIAALLIASAITFKVLRQPVYSLVQFVPDDTFYYLQIARHLSETGVSTFDGQTTTTGYHPGWMLLMTLCASVVKDRETLLRTCLALSFLLHGGTSLLLVHLWRHFLSPFWAFIGGAVWLLSPLPLMMTVMGLETSLQIFTITLALLTYQKRIAPHLKRSEPFRPPPRDLVLFSLSLAATFWGRTDSIIFITVMLLIVAFQAAVCTPHRSLLPVIARAAGIVLGTLLLAVLPWFAFCYYAVRSFSQNSGSMKMLWASDNQGALSPINHFLYTKQFLLDFWFSKPLAIAFGSSAANQNSNLLVFAGIALLTAVIAGFRIPHAVNLLRLNLALTATAVICGCVYGWFFVEENLWYFGEIALMFHLFAFGWAALLLEHTVKSPMARSAAAGIIFAFMLLLCLRSRLNNPVLWPGQDERYATQRNFEKQIPADAAIGVFNAGFPAYFSDRKVINLDGLVNDKIVGYWKTRRFDRYLYDNQMIYVNDMKSAFDRAMKFASGPVRLRIISSVPITPTERRWLWKIEPIATASPKGTILVYPGQPLPTETPTP